MEWLTFELLFFREEYDVEYQDKHAEYEQELKEWKKEAKRRVNSTVSLTQQRHFCLQALLFYFCCKSSVILFLLSRKEHAKKDKNQVLFLRKMRLMDVRDFFWFLSVKFVEK